MGVNVLKTTLLNAIPTCAGVVYGNEISFTTLPSKNDMPLPEGALPGLFSVGEGKQVYFSKGNLQYRATTGTWRFAEHQYDIVGKDNNKISETYDGWIDLFGWATTPSRMAATRKTSGTR